MKNIEKIEVQKSLVGQNVVNIEQAKGVVEIYVNAFNNTDYQGDISDPKSFNRTIKNNLARIKHLYNHDTEKFLGVPERFIVDSFGLLAVSKMNLHNEFTKNIFADYIFYAENGRTPDHSIRATMLDYDIVENGNRLVKEWALLEYSTVAFGANHLTPLVSVKSNKEIDFNEALTVIEKKLNLPYSDAIKSELETLAAIILKNSDFLASLTKKSTPKSTFEADFLERFNKIEIKF